MNRLLLLFIHLQCLTFFSISQTTDVTLYSEKGEKFILTVNGLQINDQPASRVEVYEITGDLAQINVDFAVDGPTGLQKPMMLLPGYQMTAMIRKNKKGKYVFRPVSKHPKPIAPQVREVPVVVQTTYVDNQPAPDLVVVNNHGPETSGNLDLQFNQDGDVNFNLNISKGRGTNIHSVERSGPIPSAAANLSARVEGNQILLSDGRSLDWHYKKTKHLTGVEIEMTEPIGAFVAISYDGELANETDVPFFYREPDWKKSRAYFKLTVREANGAVWNVKLQHSANNRILIDNLRGVIPQAGPVVIVDERPLANCYELNREEFNRAIASIKNKSFAEEKMIIATQVLNANCLYVSQIKAVMDQFTFEEDKLDFAKKAYLRSLDPHNYYQLNDAFTYSESLQSLNQFIESNH